VASSQTQTAIDKKGAAFEEYKGLDHHLSMLMFDYICNYPSASQNEEKDAVLGGLDFFFDICKHFIENIETKLVN